MVIRPQKFDSARSLIYKIAYCTQKLERPILDMGLETSEKFN